MSRKRFLTYFRNACLAAMPLALIFWGQSANASGVTSNMVLKPLEDKSYRPCGQDCLYSKANEYIIAKILYISEKVARVSGNKADIRTALPGFCLDNGPSGPEDTDACFTRYKRHQLIALRKLRNAYIDNTKSVQNLTTKAPGGPGVAVTDDPSTKKAQSTYLPTSEELKKIYDEETNRLYGTLGQGGYDDHYAKQYLDMVEGGWGAGEGPGSENRRPSIDDFIKFKTVLRDTQNPESEKIMVLDTGCGKATCYDDTAYQNALEDYCQRNFGNKSCGRKTVQGQTEHDKEVQAAEAHAFNNTKYRSGGKLKRAPIMDIDPKTRSSDDIDYYAGNRGIMLKTAANEPVGKGAPAGKGRAPASPSAGGAGKSIDYGQLGKIGALTDQEEKDIRAKLESPDGKSIHVTVTPEDIDQIIQKVANLP